MSVDTDDGRRPKRGYARTRIDDVDLFVSDRWRDVTYLVSMVVLALSAYVAGGIGVDGQSMRAYRDNDRISSPRYMVKRL